MNRQILKDVLITMSLMANASFFMQWSILYPYIGSYFKHYNPHITLKDIFTCILILYFGMFLGNLILPRIFYIFGLRKTLQIGSILYFVNLVCLYTFTSLIGFCFNITLAGALVNFFYFTISVFFSQKYDNGILYCPAVFMGVTVGAMIWPFVISALINPNNHSMDQITFINGYEERYYDYSVSGKIVKYFNIHGFFTMVVNVILCQFLTNPVGHSGQISRWFKSTQNISIDSEDDNEDYESFRDCIKHKLSMTMSKVFDKSKEWNVKTNRTNSLTQMEAMDLEMVPQSFKSIHNTTSQHHLIEHKEELLSTRFMLLLLVSTVRGAAFMYFINNSKYIGSFFLENDNLISVFISITSVLEIVGRLIGPYLWIRLGFYRIMFILISSSMIFNLGFILTYPATTLQFFCLMVLCRLVFGISCAVTSVTLFSLYTNEQAIYLYKVFDNVALMGLIYTVVLNYFFVWNNNFVPIFVIFLVVEGVTLALLITKLKNAFSSIN